jgi:3'-phosphoadenosine 5'-phosphosulfate sulfotransferase (PAPS reductase)/FAD synthetase
MRAEESPERARLDPFCLNERETNSRREVWTWLPIHEWDVKDVWKSIRATGVPYHYAYDFGMPRLSCVFCFYAPRAALMLAGKHNMELLARYVEVEKRIGHRFRKDLSLTEVANSNEADELTEAVSDWRM